MRISKKTKSIISGILLVAIIAGVLALAGSLLGKETKTISSTEFSVGGINAQGNYVESKTSIYTKDMFECQGLSIEPDFEATGTYQVFYYDSNKNFIGATDELNAEDGVYSLSNSPMYAKAVYARIMITPDVPVDEDGDVVEDFKIRFYEVASYAGDYKITVNKDQKYKAEDRVLTFKVTDFKQANFTEVWSLETATTTLASRAVLNMYVPVSGTDVVIHCDNEAYTYKYAIFKDEPVDGTLLAGTGFVSGDSTLSQIDDEATYYICLGFEKADKSDFTAQDYTNLAKAFSICYNG